MMKFMKTLTVVAALALAPVSGTVGSAQAEISGNLVKIGVLTDMTGAASTLSGRGSVTAAQLAAEDFAKELPGVKIEVVEADHQLKADVASSVARRWLDSENVNAIADVVSSSAALAVNNVVRGSKAVFLVSGGGTDDLTGSACSANTIHWTYDTWSVANSTVRALVKNGGTSWFFVTADYAFGQALEKQSISVVNALGGTVLGAVRHPFLSADLSSYLLTAQASGAKVIGLANSASDAANSIKQAAEFGITKDHWLAGLGLFITDVKSIGAATAQGLYVTESFYWNLDDGTRAFSTRWAARMGNGTRPTSIQAGVYAATLHYLKAVKAANTTDGPIVAAKMKELRTDDPLFGQGYIRADGRKIHNMYLFQVQLPKETDDPWNIYKLVRTVPGDEAFRPLADGGCPLVKG
jgi:branched-chain amino acid transport system substrate-binding protein